MYYIWSMQRYQNTPHHPIIQQEPQNKQRERFSLREMTDQSKSECCRVQVAPLAIYKRIYLGQRTGKIKVEYV